MFNLSYYAHRPSSSLATISGVAIALCTPLTPQDALALPSSRPSTTPMLDTANPQTPHIAGLSPDSSFIANVASQNSDAQNSIDVLAFDFAVPAEAEAIAPPPPKTIHPATPTSTATLSSPSPRSILTFDFPPEHPTPSLERPSLEATVPTPQLLNPSTPIQQSARRNQPSQPSPSTPNSAPALSLNELFDGNSDSLVARAIGSAEGTRTPDGGKTWAYQGHTDPGNGVWNLGTFSWQHGANSPEEADRKQLTRLRRQAIALTQQAEELGVPWGLKEQLNALDLANQSPSAALNPGGYIERLKQAHDQGLRSSEAILWARTWSYRHPSGTRWNAPGLGNTHHSIRADQKRRQTAIAQAINHFP